MNCPACHKPIAGKPLDHYLTCSVLDEALPIRRRKKSKSASLCIVDGCREPRCGVGGSARCKHHEDQRRLMYQRRRKGITVNRYRV